MRLRWWVGLIAVLGVLAHAHALVRHNAMVLARVGASGSVAAQPASAIAQPTAAVQTTAASEASALERDLAILCSLAHGDGSQSGGKTPSLDCPICSGLATAFALAPALDIVVAAPARALPDFFVALDQRVAVQRRLRPPGRGPPVTT